MSTLYPTSVASGVPFDKTGTSFTSDNARDAIIEAKNIAINLPRFSISAVHNATMNNGQLVGVSNAVNVPLIVPVSAKLTEVTFYQAGGPTRDGQYRFYKNAQTAPNLFFTWTLNDTTTAVAKNITNYTSPTFAQGDTLLVYFTDTGQSHSSVSMFHYFQASE